MTKTEFIQWLESATFSMHAALEGVTEVEAYDHTDDEGQEQFRPMCGGFIWNAATGTLPDGTAFDVSYQRAVEWPGNSGERFGDFKMTDDHGCEEVVWNSPVPEILDEDGDELDKWDIAELVKEHLPGMTDIDAEALIPAITITDIDADEEDTTMETITLTNDNAPDVRFTGELVASASSKDPYNNGGRWTVLRLYRTKGGSFICQEEGVTQWQGERDRSKVTVCKTEAEVIATFGHGRLAKEIYDEAGIEAVVDIE
jgi:hypothetical protein